jgi:hypothetical protein
MFTTAPIGDLSDLAAPAHTETARLVNDLPGPAQHGQSGAWLHGKGGLWPPFIASIERQARA